MTCLGPMLVQYRAYDGTFLDNYVMAKYFEQEEAEKD